MFRNFLVVVALLLVSSAGLTAVDLDDIRLPEGFAIEVYAEVPNARSLSLGDDGVVFVSNRRSDAVYAVIPGARRNQVVKIDDDLRTPNGIAYFKGDLYVAEIERVLVYRNINETLRRAPEPEVLPIELPDERHHGWRYIGFGPDDKLYISVGAPCNICDRKGFAEIIRVNPDGSGREVVARGVRNSVGFTWHPKTQEFWFTDNGRDMMGDDLPPGELNRLTQAGQHFGYPYCHGDDVLDPQFGDDKSCADYQAPAQNLPAHVAALGMAFYDADMFPESYRGSAFLAEHGSWNRSKKIGYRITRVTIEDGEATGYETFADGWLQGQQTNGRPVDVVVMPDGALLVSDDHDGKLYRIYYEEQE